MKPFNLLDGMSKNEKRSIYASIGTIALCILLLNFYNFSDSSIDENRQLGLITEIKNDTRLKYRGRVFWKSADKKQTIGTGDKIFTGDRSTATVELKDKSSIKISENSLIEFKEIDNKKMIDFSSGDFTLSVKGSLDLLINGKKTKIDGKNAQVKLTLNSKKEATFKVLNGSADILYLDKTAKLNSQGTTELNVTDSLEPKVAKSLLPTSQAFDHTWKLYDIYQKDGQKLTYKNNENSLVQKKIVFSYEELKPNDKITIEHADNSSFKNSTLHTTRGQIYVAKSYVGKNYLRYSKNNNSSSDIHFYSLTPQYLPNAEPSVFGPSDVLLIDGTAKTQLTLSAPVDASGYIVESSTDPDFIKSKTQIFWSYNSYMNLSFYNLGEYYIRARAVDKDLQLSQWSALHTVLVHKGAPLKAPRWAHNDIETLVDQSTVIAWQKEKSVKLTSVVITDVDGQTIFKTNTTQNQISWIPHSSGIFIAKMTSTDRHGRVSPQSIPLTLKVSDTSILATQQEREPQRKISSNDLTTAFDVSQKSLNLSYIKSMMSFGTAFYNFYSAAQMDSVEASPSPGVFGNVLVWLHNHGFEGLLQKNIAPSETDTTTSADMTSLEARYRYRITPRDLKVFRSFQTSVYAGYEIYKNSASRFFLDEYNLAKFGLTIDIPVLNSWLLASQIGYGAGSSTKKIEASLQFDYFFKRNWSMGAGYKIHLLERQNSPQFTSYSLFREGYTNGAVQLKYFF